MVIDRLARQHEIAIAQRQLDSDDRRPAHVYGEYRANEEVVRVVMPLTMMNESGFGIRGLSDDPARILVVCDDVNLPLGSLRLKAQGGGGGHNGLQSCLDVLGTEAVPRLRIGIGTERMSSDLRGFVLSPFDEAELPVMEQALKQAVEACEAWVKDGVEQAMNRCNKVQE
jgi:PTH1 family peptidyl-tRNA hydrolase